MIEVIGNHVRTEILRILTAEPKNAADLAEQLGVARSSVHRNLSLLEEHGLVTANVEPEMRRSGRKDVIWSTNAAAVAKAGAEWIAYATSQD